MKCPKCGKDTNKSMLQEIIESLQELEKYKQLTSEMIEVLAATLEHLKKKYPEALEDEKLHSLLTKFMALREELLGKNPVVISS